MANAQDYLTELSKEFSSHQSFDTYFKKLFHFGKHDKINLGKRLLNLYFMWEHSQSSVKHKEELIKDGFKKEALFDKRYDALIAGLLEPVSGKSKPLCKVNFVSWNYDINLLNSIKNFFYPELNYSDFFKKINKNEFVWEIEDGIKIININGYFYSSEFNGCKNLTDIGIDSIITDKIFNGYGESTDIDADADRIRFAWERSESDRNSLTEHLIKVISASENIVVIGYTFPLYNRLIDLKYLTQNDLVNKDIIVQDPNAELIKQNIKDIYGLGKRGKIKTITDCDSFYVPSTIFGIKEMRYSISVAN